MRKVLIIFSIPLLVLLTGCSKHTLEEISKETIIEMLEKDHVEQIVIVRTSADFFAEIYLKKEYLLDYKIPKETTRPNFKYLIYDFKTFENYLSHYHQIPYLFEERVDDFNF